MASVLETCKPRPELVRGTFNPEVFTAALGPVLDYYRTGRKGIDDVYTDAEAFFRDATFPTQGLRTTSRAPVNRDSIRSWLLGLSERGVAGIRKRLIDDYEVFEVPAVGQLSGPALLTVSPELYDRGLTESELPLHFASYGDPVFDALLDYFETFELPGSVCRLTVSFPELRDVSHGEKVAYAALCKDRDGVIQPKLVQSWKDVERLEDEGLVLCDDDSLTNAELEPLQRRLEEDARQELQRHANVRWTLQDNLVSAKAQQLLNYFLAAELLRTRGAAGASAQSVLRDVEQEFAGRSISVSGMPGDVLRPLADKLLFELTGPSTGKYAQVRTTPLLLESALDAGLAVESQEKKGPGALRVDALVRRLEQRASAVSKEIEELMSSSA